MEASTSASIKRKNRSFSSERPGDERGTPKALPKIPRLTTTPPEDAASAAAGGQDPDVLEEDELPSLEELSQALSEEGEKSYAEAAGSAGKATDRKDYPYLLYVHTGDEERKTMTRKTWDLFLKEVNKAVVDMVLEKGKAPRSEWNAYKRGVGFFAILDKDSQTMMKELIAAIKVAEFSFRGWAKGETGKYTPLTTILPAQMDGLPTGKLMHAITALNGLPAQTEQETHFVIRSCEARRGGSGRVLRIGVSRTWKEILESMDYRVLAATTMLEFRTGAGTPSSPPR